MCYMAYMDIIEYMYYMEYMHYVHYNSNIIVLEYKVCFMYYMLNKGYKAFCI